MDTGTGSEATCVPYDQGAIVHITPRAPDDTPQSEYQEDAFEVVAVEEDPDPPWRHVGPTLISRGSNVGSHVAPG